MYTPNSSLPVIAPVSIIACSFSITCLTFMVAYLFESRVARIDSIESHVDDFDLGSWFAFSPSNHLTDTS